MTFDVGRLGSWLFVNTCLSTDGFSHNNHLLFRLVCGFKEASPHFYSNSCSWVYCSVVFERLFSIVLAVLL